MPRRPTTSREKGRAPQARRPRWRVTFGRVVIGLAILLALLGGAFVWGLYYYLTYDLPNITSLKDYADTVPLVTTVHDDSGEVIGEFYKERRRLVPIEQMPRMMVNAFVAAEDQRFFEHGGLDYFGIARAFITNLRASETRQGGSTLTQQLARTFFLSREKSIVRKLREAILSTRMEAFLSKEEILNLYMNQIYLGHGAYGVEAAAENYFGKTVHELNVAEMALIAAMPKAPSRLNPYRNPTGAVNRQRYVIGRMLDSGFITEVQAEKARRRRLVVNPRPNPNLDEAPYFTEVVRQYMVKAYGEKETFEGGLKIYTTLNRAGQAAATAAVARGLRELDKRQGYRGALNKLGPSGIPEMLVQLDDKWKAPKEGESLRGVVTSIARDGQGCEVSLGTNRRGTLALADMSWARPPNPERASYQITRVDQALEVGDVILVKIKDKDEKGAKADTVQFELDQEPLVQAALVALEPVTGHIYAWVGGSDFRKTQFDRVIQSRRQPGSAFKPFVYATALDRGFGPTTILLDSPVSYRDLVGTVWSPKNY
ncbi:MAG: transglycosylase domain-containing protein, partial [Deltaproteobacteria bacterium]|nr:transglycosylase domain-containing protein [Deltaproteobacteria bacterium]